MATTTRTLTRTFALTALVVAAGHAALARQDRPAQEGTQALAAQVVSTDLFRGTITVERVFPSTQRPTTAAKGTTYGLNRGIGTHVTLPVDPAGAPSTRASSRRPDGGA